MILYIFLIFLCFFLHGRYVTKQKDDGICKISLLYIAIFLCCGFMCGSDWRSYETLYYEMSLRNPFEDLLMEPGLFVLMYPFRLLGINYWIFSIAIKLVCFAIFYKFIFKYAGRYKYLALMFFISFYGIYLLVDAPMRNLCAIAICLVGF